MDRIIQLRTKSEVRVAWVAVDSGLMIDPRSLELQRGVLQCRHCCLRGPLLTEYLTCLPAGEVGTVLYLLSVRWVTPYSNPELNFPSKFQNTSSPLPDFMIMGFVRTSCYSILPSAGLTDNKLPKVANLTDEIGFFRAIWH
jgi:hypothetical protein